MKRIVIIGARGHGKVVADIAMRSGYDEIRFLDDDTEIGECAGFPVVGRVRDAGKFQSCDFIVAIGEAEARRRIQESISGNIVTLIHPRATLSRRVTVGRGCVFMAGSVVNSDCVVGDGVIVNTGATIDHDCRIGDYAHVSVGAHVAGTVVVGENTWVGVGSCVSNNVAICRDCKIGAGAVVVHDVERPGTYVGVPARFLHGN